MGVYPIDGLPKSHKYRINQDGQKLFNIMKRCASMGNKVIWQYIVFNYNEDDIDTCRSMAKDINVTFKKLVSSRWGGIEHYKPTSRTLLRTSYRNRRYRATMTYHIYFQEKVLFKISHLKSLV